MKLGPMALAEGCQVVITRPNGCVLVQAMPSVDDVAGWVGRLAPLVPPDATWQVVPLEQGTPWDRGR